MSDLREQVFTKIDEHDRNCDSSYALTDELITLIRTATLDECVEIIRNMKGSHATTDYLDFIKAIDNLRGDK